ncbi:MAG: glycosyltransferase family 4 protein [Bacteroidia bacterium]|nr:glycosyltransferase family 4 protein [Bacteroidia bacterium]NNJ56383.1 glycosyltransferase family 4 protein [Bacteroidia bacterium]
MKIIATHLLNDYSGSPKVLKQLLKGWIKNGLTVELHTCRGKEGFLSEIAGVNYYYFKYKWVSNPFIRLVNLVLSQVALCINILRTSQKEDIIYINTILPFGAAFAGKIKGNRVIYHLHETSIKPAIFKSFLFRMVKWCATDVVYVSNYLAEQEPISRVNTHILHNASEDAFLAKAKGYIGSNDRLNNIVMVCSLKTYKGVHEFVTLAKSLPNHSFKLVLNAGQDDINSFFTRTHLPSNIRLYPTQNNLHPFYEWADLVLNLSLTDSWVETFGLTIIEGMAYGNPAIVPPIGGVTEIVNDGENGALINSKNINEIINKINEWSSKTDSFNKMRSKAKRTVARFNENRFIDKSIIILTNNK